MVLRRVLRRCRASVSAAAATPHRHRSCCPVILLSMCMGDAGLMLAQMLLLHVQTSRGKVALLSVGARLGTCLDAILMCEF